jgi:pyruvate/2-oxoglutarate dehydrogenase complex dihydrolipoamide acyltransferase (E2) component
MGIAAYLQPHGSSTQAAGVPLKDVQPMIRHALLIANTGALLLSFAAGAFAQTAPAAPDAAAPPAAATAPAAAAQQAAPAKAAAKKAAPKAAAVAGKCTLAGGEANMITQDLAEFMAKAALKNSIKGMNAQPVGPLKLNCNQNGALQFCKAEQKACK